MVYTLVQSSIIERIRTQRKIPTSSPPADQVVTILQIDVTAFHFLGFTPVLRDSSYKTSLYLVHYAGVPQRSNSGAKGRLPEESDIQCARRG